MVSQWFRHEADERAVVGLLSADLLEAEPVVERKRLVVARTEVDFEREVRSARNEFAGEAFDLGVHPLAESLPLERRVDGDSAG